MISRQRSIITTFKPEGNRDGKAAEPPERQMTDRDKPISLRAAIKRGKQSRALPAAVHVNMQLRSAFGGQQEKTLNPPGLRQNNDGLATRHMALTANGRPVADGFLRCWLPGNGEHV